MFLPKNKMTRHCKCALIQCKLIKEKRRRRKEGRESEQRQRKKKKVEKRSKRERKKERGGEGGESRKEIDKQLLIELKPFFFCVWRLWCCTKFEHAKRLS
jgi:hypothetical protein